MAIPGDRLLKIWAGHSNSVAQPNRGSRKIHVQVNSIDTVTFYTTNDGSLSGRRMPSSMIIFASHLFLSQLQSATTARMPHKSRLCRWEWVDRVRLKLIHDREIFLSALECPPNRKSETRKRVPNKQFIFEEWIPLRHRMTCGVCIERKMAFIHRSRPTVYVRQANTACCGGGGACLVVSELNVFASVVFV